MVTDCHVAVEMTTGGTRWGEGESRRLPGRPDRKLVASRPVLRLTFSSAQEARRRMAILIIRTFHPRTRDPVILWDSEMAYLHINAIYVQSIIRGFLTRRWWRSVTEFLQRQLGTSFLEQRCAAGRSRHDNESRSVRYRFAIQSRVSPYSLPSSSLSDCDS